MEILMIPIANVNNLWGLSSGILHLQCLRYKTG